MNGSTVSSCSSVGPRARRGRIRRVILVGGLLGSIMVIGAARFAQRVLAASPGSSPEFVPFTGTHVLTATWGAPSGGYHPYPAIDVRMTPGTPVYAAGAGTVVTAIADNRNCNPALHETTPGNIVSGATWCSDNDPLRPPGTGYPGTQVKIQHPDGTFSLYEHLSTLAAGISEGATVVTGQQIASSGNSGIATGPHLHYEEDDSNGVAVDPGTWVSCHGGAEFDYTGLQTLVKQSIRNDGYDCVAAAPLDGDFIRATDNGAVYRSAGGAPIWVSSWSAWGGAAQPAIDQTRAQIDAMPQYPADGTYVVGRARSEVYVIVGGAPVYIQNPAMLAGHALIAIDDAALDNAGASGGWSHLLQYPADGAYAFGYSRGEVYVVAGGAPVFVRTAAMLAGHALIAIDDAALDNAGGTGVWRHLRQHPSDGTRLQAWPAGAVSVVTAGVADPAAPGADAVLVDPLAIANAGGPSPWNHLGASAGSPPPSPPPPRLFAALAPVRLFDTRVGQAQGAVAVVKRRYGGGIELRVKVGGVAGVGAAVGASAAGGVAGGVGAVSLNVTVVDPVAGGFVTVYPCGSRPVVSSLNFSAGQTVPNAVISTVSAGGEVCFYSSVDTNLVADVNGWFAGGSGFSALAPVRLFDTRVGQAQGAVAVVKQRYGGGAELRVKVAGVAGVASGVGASAAGGVAGGVGAVSLNVTVVDPVAGGFVTVYPCGSRPVVSSLNFSAGQTVPNAVISTVSAGGEVCFYSSVDTNLVADVNGWFAG